MITREKIDQLVTTLLAAVERVRSANSEDSRAAAKVDAKAANDALQQATGMIDLYRSDMMIQARALPAGAKVDAADFPKFARDCRDGTSAGQIRMLHALAQYAVHGTKLLSKPWAGVLADQLLANAEGRYGPFDPVWAAGVARLGDPAENIRRKVVLDTGYTIGVTIGATGKIPDMFWSWAARWQNKLAAEARGDGYEVLDLDAATIQDLCQKKALKADLFRASRRDGAAAARAPDRLRMLPTDC
jgi:hypothetical protein